VLERVYLAWGRKAEYIHDRTYGVLDRVKFVSFDVLKAKFVQRTRIVDEDKELDMETRRAWNALRSTLMRYARLCGEGSLRSPTILVGEANWADAWTDGESYIAIGIDFVRALRTEPLKGAGSIFSLFEHELCHEGESSLDCGHDEAFYQRFHDLVLGAGGLRQRMIHEWVMRYTRSLENSVGSSQGKKAWKERFLMDKASMAREVRGLSRMSPVRAADAVINEEVAGFDPDLANRAQATLVRLGFCPSDDVTNLGSSEGKATRKGDGGGLLLVRPKPKRYW
jgi:hypothetical protein